jgi:hypothetical protein
MAARDDLGQPRTSAQLYGSDVSYRRVYGGFPLEHWLIGRDGQLIFGV